MALTTFSDLVQEARERVKRDALAAGCPTTASLLDGGTGATAYAEAVAVYLALAVSKLAIEVQAMHLELRRTGIQWCSRFRRQALPMTWDFRRGESIRRASGSFTNHCESSSDV